MITSILGVFHNFCKSARSASRQRENFMESLHSDGSATYLLIIWVEKIIPLGMKSKQKPYPSIVFLSIVDNHFDNRFIIFINSNLCIYKQINYVARACTDTMSC